MKLVLKYKEDDIMPKVSFNQADCQAMVRSVEKNGNEMVGVDTIQQYQKSFIEVLCSGWITKHGKDYIDNTIVVKLNADIKKLAAALQRYADYMEQVASRVAEEMDDGQPYAKVNPKIVCGTFNSNNSKADIGGTHYLDNDSLEKAKNAIDNYIKNRLKRNHDQIVSSWGKYHEAFGKDGKSLVEEWKTNFDGVYKSAIKNLNSFNEELDRVIKSKKADTEKARSEMEKVKAAGAQIG